MAEDEDEVELSSEDGVLPRRDSSGIGENRVRGERWPDVADRSS